MSKQEKNCPIRKTYIGGQALMEGIMMRGPEKTAMAVRKPNGDIILEDWKNQASKRPRIAKLPIIRGVVGFVDSMITGYKCLMRSAEVAALEDVVEASDDTDGSRKDSNITLIKGNGPVPGYLLSELNEKEDKKKKRKDGDEKTEKESTETASDAKQTSAGKDGDDKISKGAWNAMMGVSIVFALVLCVVFFVILPSFLYILFSGLMLKLDPENILFLPDIANVGKWSWRAVAGMFGAEYAAIDPLAISAGTLALRSLIN